MNPWWALVRLASARAAMGMQFQSVGALGAALIGAGLVPDYAALGTLIGAYSLAGIAVSLPAGWLLARFGDRRILLAALGLMALGGAAGAWAPDFATALAARIVAGIGAALLSIVGAKIVLDRFSGPALVTAMGILLSAWPFGIALALVILPALGEFWRGGLLLVALLCAASVPLLWTAVAPRTRISGAGPAAVPMAWVQPREWPGVLAVGTIWAAFNAAIAVVLGFAPAFLIVGGMAPPVAGVMASAVGWAILPLLPFGGAIAERFGRPALSAAVCFLGMAASLLALISGAPPLACLIAFGLLSGPPASLTMALLGRVIAPESRAFGVGVHYTMFYAGMAGVPPLAGLLRDVSGRPDAPLLAAIAMLGVALAALAVVPAAAGERRN